MCLPFVEFSPVPVKKQPRTPLVMLQNQDVGSQSPNKRSSSHHNVHVKPLGVVEGKQDLPSESRRAEALEFLQKIPERIIELCDSLTQKVNERKELEFLVAGMRSSFSPGSCHMFAGDTLCFHECAFPFVAMCRSRFESCASSVRSERVIQ